MTRKAERSEIRLLTSEFLSIRENAMGVIMQHIFGIFSMH